MIALITGANKGIGYETARLLAEKDVTVLAGARDEERGRAAAERLGTEARFVRLDVTSADSIAAAAKLIEEEYGVLDILVNNAGIAIGGWTPGETTPGEVRDTFETNVVGVVAVTNAMLPMLRRAAAARIVNVSSELGSLTLAADPQSPYYELNGLAYQASKAALNMVTLSYAKDLRGTPIKVNAANPGYCATDLNDHQGHRTAEQGALVSVELALLDDDGPTGAFVGDEGPLPW